MSPITLLESSLSVTINIFQVINLNLNYGHLQDVDYSNDDGDDMMMMKMMMMGMVILIFRGPEEHILKISGQSVR